MNKRIIELEKQAYTEVMHERGGTYMAFDKEKFAELIVAECIAICQDIDGEDNTDARSGRQDCAVEIREHFGVK